MQNPVQRALILTTIIVSASFLFNQNSFAAGSCTLPATLQTAYAKAVKYKTSCQRTLDSFNRTAVHGSNGPENIAISDYTIEHPIMYIMDSNGKCLYSQNVDFGSGGGKMTPHPSCKDSSHATPPGFHVVATDHTSGKYPPPNSLLMVGLEGQNSGDRHILIHKAKAGGVGCTWGCSGVSDYEQVKNLLGGGSLVYNYFGEKGKSAHGCSGVGSSAACKPDHYAKSSGSSRESTANPSGSHPVVR